MEVLRRFGSVPPLGSHKDIILRQYLNRELNKEALLEKITLLSNLPLKDQAYKDLIREFQKWSSLHFLQDETSTRDEDLMREAYSRVLTLQPKLVKGKDGSLSVEGLRDLLKT